MFLTDLVRRHRARREYEKASCTYYDINRELYTVADPASRADLLDQMAAMQGRLAVLTPVAWGPDPIPVEGRDRSESLGSSATLLYTLAAAERERVRPNDPSDMLAAYLEHMPSGEASIWRKLVTVDDHAHRASLIGHAANYAVERVGMEAVQSLLEGFYSERELAAAEREGRAPAVPKRMKSSRMVIAAAFLTAGVLIELPDLLSLIH